MIFVMEIESTQKGAIEYFRANIVEAKTAYTLLKALYLSRSEYIVGKNLFHKYFDIQSKYKNFFGTIEQGVFITFVVKICHCFDRDDRSYSFKDIDKAGLEVFSSQQINVSVINEIKEMRDKVIAHYH